MSKLLFVLSMHRSGSSLVAKGLETCGVSLGNNLMEAAPDNPKGFFEDKEVYELNERLLNALDFQWALTGNDPTPLSSSELVPFRDEIETLLKKKLEDTAGNKYLGIKDPRICRLAPIWFDVCNKLNIPFKVIYLSRDPHEVAHSLKRRNRFNTSGGIALWYDYNRRAMQSLIGLSPLFIELRHFQENMSKHLDAISEFLATDVDAESKSDFIANFYEPSLLHSSKEETNFSSKLYEAMKAVDSPSVLNDEILDQFLKQCFEDEQSGYVHRGTIDHLNWHRKAECNALRELLDSKTEQFENKNQQYDRLRKHAKNLVYTAPADNESYAIAVQGILDAIKQ